MRRPRKKSLGVIQPQGFHYTKDEYFNPLPYALFVTHSLTF